jgi:Big-like domain-containing protein/WD40 repeat protein
LSEQHIDPELTDVLQDPELLQLASMLGRAETPEPPLDDAFRSALRRQLMDIAWGAGDGRVSWWRQLLSPPRLSWVGAAAVVVLVATVVIYTAVQPPGGFTQVIVQSPQQDQSAVALHQPILVSFNQPMDRPSTEKAVQITPATTVTFSWNGDAQLYIQPVSGDLAPNTQYQVTIGPGALTKSQQPLTTPTTITFVTQPSTPAAPTPSPTPRVSTLLLSNQQVATVPSAASSSPLWSPDSSTLYFVGAGGALLSLPAKGGSTTTLVADGVSLPAITSNGDRIAYARGGNIEVITLATKATTSIAVSSAPTFIQWVGDNLLWGAGDGIYTLSGGAPSKVVPLPTDTPVTVVSISRDGIHAVYQQGSNLFLLNIANGSNVQLGGAGAAGTFQAWSPSGTRVVYGNVIADLNGKTVNRLPEGDVSWSVQNVILLGSDTAIYSIRPDGTGLTKLADGTFHAPVWAPDASTFVYVRGNSLWVATAPAATPVLPTTEQASAVVTAFMNARLNNEADAASGYLDDNGKATYATGNPALIPNGDQQFKRFYILLVEVDPSAPNTVRVVVRMVFGQNKHESAAVDETLTLQRALDTDPFLIDGVIAGTRRDVGKGPEVVSVKVTDTQVDVTFDSDLVPSSISNVVLQDSTGATIQVTPTYSDRTVTFSGLQLTPGAHYRLVVQPSVQDVGNRLSSGEYDLDFVGPAPEPTSGGAPSPSPSPSPAASPAPAMPSPTASPSA